MVTSFGSESRELLQQVMKTYDAIVVGGGHNGLTAAAYLASGGADVLVLERRAIVGGAAVTEEVMPECRVSFCSYIASMLTPAVVKELGLADHGLKMVPCDPALNVPTSNEGLVTLWSDPLRTAASLRPYSQKDAENFVVVEHRLKALARYLQPFFLKPPPTLSGSLVDRVGELASIVRQFWGISRDEVASMTKFLTGSLAEFLERHFESEETHRLFLANNVYGKHGGPYDPGSTLGLLFHLLGGGDQSIQGFSGHVIGGMGSVSDALANAAQGFGAEIITNAEVAQILIRDGRACGVELVDGRTFQSKTVVSNADPKRTFLGLVSSDCLDPEFRSDIAAIKMAGPSAKVNMVLSEPPAVTGMSPDATPQERAVFSVMGGMAAMQRCYDASKFGEVADELWIDCVVPSMVDPTLCPADRTMLTCFVQYVPYSLREGDWDTRREALGDQVVKQIGQVAPNVPASVIARTVITPLDLERTYGLTEGNIFHGDLNLGQLFFMRPHPDWSGYRTPLAGLYLCGAGTHPGGGVTGAPGRNAAQVILKDLRR